MNKQIQLETDTRAGVGGSKDPQKSLGAIKHHWQLPDPTALGYVSVHALAVDNLGGAFCRNPPHPVLCTGIQHAEFFLFQRYLFLP